MLWLGGFPALEVTTSTPDALCPAVEEARAAIKARVGEVQGDYRLEFALVRSGDSRQVLELSLREGPKPVLERELSLTGVGCQDAAQAIALVLERYFDAVEKDVPDTSNPEPIPVRPSVQPPPKLLAPPPPPRRASEPSPPAGQRRAWVAHVGFDYDWTLGFAPTLGLSLFPAAWRWGTHAQIGLALDVAPFLTSLTQRVREQEISASTLQTALWVPVAWRFQPWAAAVGPWAQLRVQRAEATSLAHAQPAYRLIAGWGGVVQLSWSPAPLWTLGCALAAGAQAAGATSRFTLQRAETGSQPVLVPESWFGQGQLTLSRDL